MLTALSLQDPDVLRGSHYCHWQECPKATLYCPHGPLTPLLTLYSEAQVAY